MRAAANLFRFASAWLLALGLVPGRTPLEAADSSLRAYDLPRDRAERTLKLFSQQSGHSVIMAAETVHTIRTNAVKGTFTAPEALARMLAGTGLSATRDGPTGAFAVRTENARRDPPPPAGAKPATQ